MKNLIVVLAALAIAGCSQAPVSSTATLVGAHDMVLIDKLLFTTSTDRDELRALDLTPPAVEAGARQFVRAPNPLEALSIPVLNRPSALARDTHYEDLGRTLTDGGFQTIALGSEVGGPWVYATRAGGSEISIVGGGPKEDPLQLIEVKRLPTSAAVTASAGLWVSATLSRLFFATWDGEAGTLQSLDLPGTVTALRAAETTALVKQVKVFAPFPGEVIVDILVVPGIAGRGICEIATESCVVLATRTLQGRAGRVLLFDPQTLAVRALNFGRPVRFLATHAGTITSTGYISPGQRVFGILDEESCGSTDCGGVLAVDTFTGEVALDSAGLPMLPISTGASLATGLSVVARGDLLLPPSLVNQGNVTRPTPVELSAAGVITTSNGTFIFFDANGLTPFDLDTNRTFANPINVGLYRPDGVLNLGDAGFPAYVAGPVFDAGVGITFANGAWRSEVIDVVVNGFIPGLEDRQITSSGNDLNLGDPVLVSRVRVGDTVIFNVGGGCRAAVAAINGTTVSVAPNTCDGRTRFGIRADGDERYVVNATLTGYLGRSGPDRTFSYKGPYYQRTPPFDPNIPTFSVVLGSEQPRLPEDWRWSIDIQPADTPFALRVSSQAVGCSTNVASSVIWDDEHTAVFSVFPSANGIIELNPRRAANESDLDEGVDCWR